MAKRNTIFLPAGILLLAGGMPPMALPYIMKYVFTAGPVLAGMVLLVIAWGGKREGIHEAD